MKNFVCVYCKSELQHLADLLQHEVECEAKKLVKKMWKHNIDKAKRNDISKEIR